MLGTMPIECRDAVLAWDEIVHRPEKDRSDPTPRNIHPVTGELVPRRPPQIPPPVAGSNSPT